MWQDVAVDAYMCPPAAANGSRVWTCAVCAAASFNALLSGIVKDLENDDEEGTLAFRCAAGMWLFLTIF